MRAVRSQRRFPIAPVHASKHYGADQHVRARSIRHQPSAQQVQSHLGANPLAFIHMRARGRARLSSVRAQEVAHLSPRRRALDEFE